MNDDVPVKQSSTWKKITIAVVGSVIVLAGVIMLVTPGPGLVLMAAGLAVLATEFHWARRALDRVRERIHRQQTKRRD